MVNSKQQLYVLFQPKSGSCGSETPSVVMAGLDPRLSGLILWTERMTLILLLSGRFATIWTRKGINAMR
ncbi:MAG: hypothetical protein ACLPX9_03900, partial [Rhodomicrobium sp.]